MNKTTRIIAIILFCIVLLPTLFYSVYEFSALDETEMMISEIYNRQLDAILFSVNQYVLDVASSQATEIENGLRSRNFDKLFQSNTAIQSIIIADKRLSACAVFPPTKINYLPTLLQHKNKIDRLVRYQEADYRKLEPVVESDSTVIIFFVPHTAKDLVVGIVARDSLLIKDIIGKKLNEVAQKEFIVAVIQQSTNSIVFSTAPVTPGELSQQRQLWILPDHAIGIRLRSMTIQEAASQRFRRNIILMIILDVVLLFGVWFVYRTVRREMDLIALKSDFVSNVSHELRTPLALIRMFAETLEMGRVKTEKKKKEYYSIILHETERLTRLINNILNFSRMESHTRKYVFKPANINQLIISVLEIYSYQLKQMKFTVETLLDKSLPAVSIDEEGIAEALHNLIDNAIKYSKNEKFLRIATLYKQNNVQIRVEDRGIGIPQEHHAKIFEKFYRVSHGLVHTAKGSGLGLAIVYHIIHSHGGTIAVESEPEKGSTFIITLPVSERQNV